MTADLTTLPTIQVGDIPFAAATLEEASAAIIRAATAKRGESVRFANAFCVVIAQRDDRYRSLMQDHGTNFADGAPVARILGAKYPDGGRSFHVRGPSCFEDVLRKTSDTRMAHFFIAPDGETASKLAGRLQAEFPGVNIAGIDVPPHLAAEALVKRYAEVLATIPFDFVWVGLGSPKQDFVTTGLSRQLDGVFGGVGAALSFFAGTVDESPEWMRRLQLEWLFRLAAEPRRLWRRYLIGNFQFLWRVRFEWKVVFSDFFK